MTLRKEKLVCCKECGKVFFADMVDAQTKHLISEHGESGGEKIANYFERIKLVRGKANGNSKD